MKNKIMNKRKECTTVVLDERGEGDFGGATSPDTLSGAATLQHDVKSSIFWVIVSLLEGRSGSC